MFKSGLDMMALWDNVGNGGFSAEVMLMDKKEGYRMNPVHFGLGLTHFWKSHNHLFQYWYVNDLLIVKMNFKQNKNFTGWDQKNGPLTFRSSDYIFAQIAPIQFNELFIMNLSFKKGTVHLFWSIRI